MVVKVEGEWRRGPAKGGWLLFSFAGKMGKEGKYERERKNEGKVVV